MLKIQVLIPIIHITENNINTKYPILNGVPRVGTCSEQLFK